MISIVYNLVIVLFSDILDPSADPEPCQLEWRTQMYGHILTRKWHMLDPPSHHACAWRCSWLATTRTPDEIPFEHFRRRNRDRAAYYTCLYI